MAGRVIENIAIAQLCEDEQRSGTPAKANLAWSEIRFFDLSPRLTQRNGGGVLKTATNCVKVFGIERGEFAAIDRGFDVFEREWTVTN